ncbi:hypothetical protein K488DRAFT_68617 [Vararia minispora EC-137]|uniref:Uncharacterized protein n=1 Tax=Vararia minispora EC-137 TaxID=1314806 RepID=A0ACB8QU94_9AGAM|nr:hypothetical protein K488DRAFT_68617 [Vararia minispora EC-137]
MAQEPPSQRRRTSRQVNASITGTGKNAKNPKPCEKNILISRGPKGVYKFKLNRMFKVTCYEYKGQELSAEEIARLDPEWLANEWPGSVLERPCGAQDEDV